jgi:predicted RNA binding protein YcfA (HicA-like mRNA interferase family)
LPRLRRLSGDELIRILGSFGFEIASQSGSHAKLLRERDGQRQILVVPRHRQLDTGMCRAIFKQACRFIPEDELRPHFYSD